jgi:hypothetical protein
MRQMTCGFMRILSHLEIHARWAFAFKIALADLSNQLTELPFDYSALQNLAALPVSHCCVATSSIILSALRIADERQDLRQDINKPGPVVVDGQGALPL